MNVPPNASGVEREPAPEASLAALLRVIRPIFRTHWPRLAVGFLALVTVDFLQLIIPRFVKTAVDSLAAQTALPSQLLDLSLLVMLVAGAVAVLRFVWRYLIIGFSRILEKKLRDRLFDHAQWRIVAEIAGKSGAGAEDDVVDDVGLHDTADGGQA